MAGVKVGCEDARKKGKKKKTFGRKKIYGLREAYIHSTKVRWFRKRQRKASIIIRQALIHE